MSELILASLKASHADYIDLPAQTLYWDLSEDQRYDLSAEPRKLLVGDLADDWQHLTDNILSGDADSFGHTFVTLASILRTIGEKATT